MDVTADTYVRAETDLQLRGYADKLDCFGHFRHGHDPYDVHNQITVRGNRDTLYSFGVFDLATPLTVRLPNPGKRYMSLMTVTQDHSIAPTLYAPATVTLQEDSFGSRYGLLLVRTFADPNDDDDMAAAHALQDEVHVDQAAPGGLALPDWDPDQVVKLREAINVLAATMSDTSTFFGIKDDLNPIHHLMGTALGWGGLPREAAVYVNVFPDRNDGSTPYVLEVPSDVPVGAFWSVTVYDGEGYMTPNENDLYSMNSVTATPNPDGSFTLRFGGDPSLPNHLPIGEGWNYIVRLYRPSTQILEGAWHFPAASPASTAS